jgi:hypothetical protein
VTPNEKALIEASVKWAMDFGFSDEVNGGCDCAACKLCRAVRRVVKERKCNGVG